AYLYQIEYIIRKKITVKKVVKFIGLVIMSCMATILIYTTALNWDYIYDAFASIGTPVIASDDSEITSLSENQKIEPSTSPKVITPKSKLETPNFSELGFKKGVEEASNAAFFVQTAKTQDEWEFVAAQWDNAINYMKQVQPSDPNYDIAQDRVIKYQKNLEYARLAASKAPE
ncbi:MAG: hypothetical protein SWJ54_09915, partial [Cyanobacteriota bacterium]|nr:hypothetical protein [Cyanobacteriota bacterium]